MEQKFHAFVRKHPGRGYTVSVLTHPHLASFAEDLETARADLSTVLSRLLARDDEQITRIRTHWPDARARRVDVAVHAMQHGRILAVPMRFTVVTHEEALPERAIELPLRKSLRARVRVVIPRLDFEGWVADLADLETFVQETVRFELYLAPVTDLLDAAFDGDEFLETLSVAYRPRTPRGEDAAKKNALDAVPPALAETSRRLNDEFRKGTLDRAFQRDAEVASLLRSVSVERSGGALLVGPSGAGKTAVVHEAVARIVESETSAAHHGVEVFTTSGARIVAGMHYLGQWQQRLQRMLDELRSRRSVLHFESLLELLGAGHGEQGLDVARYLLPAIESGEVALWCEATPDEILRAERTHPALLRALARVAVAPLRGEGANRALVSAAGRVARTHKVRFTEAALARAADLTERFGEGAALPGGAVQLLRAAATSQGISTANAKNTPRGGTARLVGPDEVTAAFTHRTGYPREIVDPAVPLDPDAVLARLRARVVGQDAAMVLLRDLVVTLKTSLSDPTRPLGSFLLLGPTGVGKTESALALAEYLFGDARRMVRFDMSEYAAPGSAARLVSEYGGAEGPLARRVREQPFGVVLLDEVEKADESVHDLLLQVLGEGRLTDATGRTVSFRNTVVILTSNLGADTAGRSLGFGDATRDADAHYLAAATAFFRPELLNRFDHVVPYAPLSRETVRALARRAIERALSREGLARRNVRVHFDDAVVERVASLGFDPNQGARPLNRAVERWVVAPVARVLSARGAKPPAEMHLVVRGAGVAVAPTSAPEVASLDEGALAQEIARRASLARASLPVALVLRPETARARLRAEWLAERMADWVRSRGGEAELEPGPAPGERSLRARGGAAGLLRAECGLHEFVTGGDAVRVWVRDAAAGGAQPDAARLYTDQPEESVLDVETGLEFVGGWESALAGPAMDRFVLARDAERG